MDNTTTKIYEGVGKTREEAYDRLNENNKLPRKAEIQYQVRVNTEGSMMSDLFPEYEAALIQGIARSGIPAEELTPEMLEVKAVVECIVKNKPKPTGSVAIRGTSTLNDLV